MAKEGSPVRSNRDGRRDGGSSTVVTMLPQAAVRIPPQNVEAETSVIGALMLDGEAIIKIAEVVNPEDFYRPDHQLIFEAITRLFEKRQPIDVLTVTEELEKQGKLDQAGGASTLAAAVAAVPTATNVRHYAQIVREKAVLRRIISAGTGIAELGYHEDMEIAAVLDQSEQQLFQVSQRFLKNNFTPIADILSESFDRIDKLHQNKGELRGTPTGFHDMDNLLAGLQASDLIILAARPGMGKTSLALNIAEHVACDKHIPVAVFSLEMSREQLVDRLLCSQAGIDLWKLRTGNLQDDDFQKLGIAMGMLSEAPIFIDDSAMATAMEVRAKARRLQMEQGGKLGLVVIDYLQLMVGGGKNYADNRVQEVSEISRSLKALARDLNVPVLALSQLSRTVESRRPQIPQLSDLRESGSIEQDADVVMFIYREEYYDQLEKKETTRPGIADLFVAKHRNGPTGKIELFFKKEWTSFQNLDQRHGTTPVPEQVD